MELYHNLLALSTKTLVEIKLKLDDLLLIKTDDPIKNLTMWNEFLDTQIYPLNTESFSARHNNESTGISQQLKDHVDKHFNLKLQRLIFEYDKKNLHSELFIPSHEQPAK